MDKGGIEKAGLLLTAATVLTGCALGRQDLEIKEQVKKRTVEPTPLSEQAGQICQPVEEVKHEEEELFVNGFFTPIEREPYTVGPQQVQDKERESFSVSSHEKITVVQEVGTNAFDEEVLDIWKWDERNMETVWVEREEVVVEVIEPTRLYSVDLSGDGLVKKNLAGYFTESTLASGTLDIVERKKIMADDGSSVVLGILPYDEEAKNVQAVVLEAVDSELQCRNFVTYHEELSAEEYTPLSLSSTERHQIVDEVQHFVDYVYDPENLAGVWDIIVDDPTIQSVFDLKEALDDYDDNSGMLVADYLRGTEWYRSMVAKVGEETVNEAIKIPDTVRIQGQPIQCVLFDRMMNRLYPELNIPEVRTGETGYAKEIAQFVFRPSSEIRTIPLWYGPMEITGSNIPIDMYEPGDIFVTIGGTYGHTGVILGKYEDYSGEPFLIVVDSNRAFDGRIKVLLVDKNNIGTILGDDYMFIIRSQ